MINGGMIMYLNGLDELDQKIVQLLIKNARFSYSDIGKEVGISRVAVKARIQALEKKGVIEEYTTIINPQKISGAISCYFEIETLSNSFTDVIEILNQNNIVTQIYRVTGKNTLLLLLIVKWRISYILLLIHYQGLLVVVVILFFHVLKILKDYVYSYRSSFLIKELFENE
jgi:DNA-binding Lrp family transcriptional regulator